jgi:hypothetical protein
MISKSLNLGRTRCGIDAVQKLEANVQATGAARSLRAAKTKPAANEGSNKRLKLAQAGSSWLKLAQAGSSPLGNPRNSDDAVNSD